MYIKLSPNATVGTFLQQSRTRHQGAFPRLYLDCKLFIDNLIHIPFTKTLRDRPIIITTRVSSRVKNQQCAFYLHTWYTSRNEVKQGFHINHRLESKGHVRSRIIYSIQPEARVLVEWCSFSTGSKTLFRVCTGT